MVDWIRERTLGHVVVLIFGWVAADILASLFLLAAIIHSTAKAHPGDGTMAMIGFGNPWEFLLWFALLIGPPIWLLRTWMRQSPARGA